MDTGIAFTLFGLEIRWYGILIALGFVLGYVFVSIYNKKYGYDKDLPIDLILWVAPLSIIGARLYYVIFEWETFAAQENTLAAILRIWDGGLAIYGGIIGGVIGALLYCRFGFYDGLFIKEKRKRFSFWKIADLVVPSLALGQAIGRWGNFFNKEAFGKIVTNEALHWFPMSVYIDIPHKLDGVACTEPWHYATFFYESLWCFLLFGFLLYYREKHKKAEGEMLFWYLALYGFERMLVEGLRADSLYIWNTNIRVSQVLSGIMMVVGIVFIVLLRSGKLKLGDHRKPKTEAVENVYDACSPEDIDGTPFVNEESENKQDNTP